LGALTPYTVNYSSASSFNTKIAIDALAAEQLQLGFAAKDPLFPQLIPNDQS